VNPSQSSPPFWRDPLMLLPVITLLVAAALFGVSWREFGQTRPAAEAPTPTATPTPEPSDPQALALLEQMEAAMNRLRTLKTIEVLRDDSGHTVTSTLLYAAPDKVYVHLSTGAESISLGPRQWAHEANQSLWRVYEGVEPFTFPDYHYYSRQAVDVQPGADTHIDGQPMRAVTFAFLGFEGRFDFVVYADSGTMLFRRLTMEGPGHHMRTDFVDYAPTVTIILPPPDRIAPTPTVIAP
jgi:hypothetical protein